MGAQNKDSHLPSWESMVENDRLELRCGVEQRLEFIEFWEGMPC